MLYHIDNLREAVETAKRVLPKEQMDKKAGQSSASQFMQISQSSSKNKDNMEKKVSFSAVEAMERTTDSIERLASLMDRMDTKLDRRQDQYRPRVYQGRSSQSRSSSQNRYKSRRQSRDDTRIRDRSESRSRSSSHVSTNRDRSRCYRCNEYDHFA